MAENETDNGYGRLMTFTDALFAVTVGVLALHAQLPDILTMRELTTALAEWLPSVGVLALVFLILAGYWSNQHLIFAALRQRDDRVVWVNWLTLLGVAFLPVAAGLLARYPTQIEIFAIFAGYAAVVGLLQCAAWWVETHDGAAFDGMLNLPAVRYISLRLLVLPVVLLLSISVALINPTLAQVAWLAAFPLMLGLRYVIPSEKTGNRIMRAGARFKLSDAEWGAVKAEMRAIMEESARRGETITYSEIAAQLQTGYLHPHSFTFTHLLREIGTEEDQAGRPQLCALVVSKATGMPGGGYFTGVPHDSVVEFEAAWRQDLEAVFAYWKEH